MHMMLVNRQNYCFWKGKNWKRIQNSSNNISNPRRRNRVAVKDKKPGVSFSPTPGSLMVPQPKTSRKSAEKNAVFIIARRHWRHTFECFCEVRKGIEAKQSRNISETVVFADKLFAFLDFQFEVVVYNRFTRALTERFAKSGFSVM